MKRTIKKILLLLILFGLGGSCLAQQTSAPFCGFTRKGGFYADNHKREYITREATSGDASGIPDVITEIKNITGIKVDIRVYIAEAENNCYATISEDGERLLIADFNFLNEVNQYAGTKWAAISILAHEVGHHIAGFNRHPKKSDNELDADYWSGYILGKLGASENAARKCILTYGTEYDSYSHPNKYSRAKAISEGWMDAMNGTINYDRCAACEP